MSEETQRTQHTAIATRASIQKRESTLPIHASYYQQIRKVNITKRDKRYLVYIFFLLSFSLLFLSRSIISARCQSFVLARAAIGQQQIIPESNLFAYFLLISLGIGAYALLASFYRQVPTQYFLSVSILLLLFPPVFLGMELYSMYQYHSERSAKDAQFFLQVLKQEIESEEEFQIEEMEEKILRLSTSFPFIRNIGITSDSHLILSCSRRRCLNFKQTEGSEEYQIAKSLCREAKYQSSLQTKEGGTIELCVATRFLFGPGSFYSKFSAHIIRFLRVSWVQIIRF